MQAQVYTLSCSGFGWAEFLVHINYIGLIEPPDAKYQSTSSPGLFTPLPIFNRPTHTTIGQTQVDFVDFHRWVETNSQCWSESGLVSPAVSPSPQGQSPSPSPSGQSPSPSGVSPSPVDQSPSPSPLDQSPSPSPVGPSPSPSPWVRTQHGLMGPTIEKYVILILL